MHELGAGAGLGNQGTGVHRCLPVVNLVRGAVAGTVSIGVWGKPPLSHSNDPLRALAAARQLCSSLRAIALRFRRGDAIGAPLGHSTLSTIT